jgi:hypothetical protein
MSGDKFYQPENREQPTIRHTFSKWEFDLYREEDDVKLPTVRVKHVVGPGKGERWKIFEDTALILVLEGRKLTKREKSFLHSIEGVSFIISEYKHGARSFNSLKLALKEKLKAKP